MVFYSLGHVKVIDFGTAKDVIQVDLNGPEFVGTSEYMSPATVDGKLSGIEADLWALGIIIYQLIFGYTPFHAPTPYLSFLKIKRANLKVSKFQFITNLYFHFVSCYVEYEYSFLPWLLMA